MKIFTIFIYLFVLTSTFTASAAPQQKLPPGSCVNATAGKAICDNTKYCNCATNTDGDAICTNDNCIAAITATGKAICHGPSCIAAEVTVGTAECKGKSCRLVGKTSGHTACSGGKCDCVGQYTDLKGHCADERKKIEDWIYKYQ